MILVDAGPLVAIVEPRDQHHAQCIAALSGIKEPMATVWPVLNEVMYLLAGDLQAQEDVWEMIARGAVQLLTVGAGDIPRIRTLMRKYSNRPMDLADAALIAIAEREGIRRFFSVDRHDFAVYRIHGAIRPTIIP